MTTITRNVQGAKVRLEFIDIDPDAVVLDASNPRVSFTMRQLEESERNDGAATVVLTSQEDTEGLKRSIVRSHGVQEPIYLRLNGTVAEGNRRVVAMRAAKEEHPGDPRFSKMPAWRFADDIDERVIQDLLNEIHLGNVRGWAPYEKALQMKELIKGSLTEDEIAERYRMTASEVRNQIAAVEMMDELFFPIVADRTEPAHRTRFSYFLEFKKNGKIQDFCDMCPDLPARFAAWVRDDRISTGAAVRRLPKILASKEATQLLEVIGFEAADEYIKKQNPNEQELYAILEAARARLSSMDVEALIELRDSPERQAMIRAVRDAATKVLEHFGELEN
jgi:hypothetical protein